MPGILLLAVLLPAKCDLGNETALIDEEEKEDRASCQMGLFQGVQQIPLRPQHPLLIEYAPYITPAPGVWRQESWEMLSYHSWYSIAL